MLRATAKIRYCFYLSILLLGVLVNFWINHGWQVIIYAREVTRPIVEMQRRYALRKDNIVLSLTTTPYRINKLRPVLETLYAQNINISKIYLNIPYVFKRDNIVYDIPDWLIADTRVTILRTEDFGPATKLLGLLENEKLPANTIIVTVDDDMYYPSNLVLHLAYEAKVHPDSAITMFGGDVDYDKNGNIRRPGIGIKLRFEPSAPVATIFGYAGVAYRAEFFDAQIFNVRSAPQECFMHDDFYISFHLARRAVPRRNLSTLLVTSDHVTSYDENSRQPQALYLITPNRAILVAGCLAYLRTQYPNVDF